MSCWNAPDHGGDVAFAASFTPPSLSSIEPFVGIIHAPGFLPRREPAPRQLNRRLTRGVHLQSDV